MAKILKMRSLAFRTCHVYTSSGQEITCLFCRWGLWCQMGNFSSFNVGKPWERDSDTLLQKGKHNIKSVSTQLKSFSTFAPQRVTSGSPGAFQRSEKCQACTTLSAPIHQRPFPGDRSLFFSLWSTGLSTKVTPLSLSSVLTHSWVKSRSEIATNL